jgi:hypothetical protein
MPIQSMTRATTRPITQGNDDAWDHCPHLRAPVLRHDITGKITAASTVAMRSSTRAMGGCHGNARR